MSQLSPEGRSVAPSPSRPSAHSGAVPAASQGSLRVSARPGGPRTSSAIVGLEVERGPVFSMLGGAELATGTDGDRVVDLFLRGGELAGILAGALRRGAWLDAYLSAAGLQQLVDDRAPASQAFLRRTARHLLKGSRPLVHAGGQALSRVDGVLTAASARTTGGSHLVALSEHLAVLLDELAPLVLGGAPSGAGLSQAAVSTRLAVLAADVEAVAPVLGGDVIRLPSCFHSFDQHPADMAALVRRFVERWPDRSIPVAVAGIRTSGGYLAPLCAAALRELGFEHAESLSLRPGSAMSGAVVERLRGVVGRGGLVLLVDDPPITGRSYREAIDQLARVSGVARSSVVVLLASFSEDEEPPAGLAGLASVVLPYSEWDIVRRLGMPSATDSLSGLLPPGARLSRVEAIAPALPPRRGHARALLAMDWQDGSGWHRRELVAEGTGLGFFGRQAVEVARRAPTLFPEILGLADGVLFRELLPEELSWAARPVVLADAEPVARHLADRHAALRRPDDPTVSFAGRQAAREVAAREIARTLGPLAEPLGPFLAGAAVRRILDTSVPTLIDGDVARENWFFAPGQPPRKASFAEGPFGHHDLASYDPVFDLAGTAVAARDLAFEDALRERYAGLTGLVAEPARWMLLELVHLWNERRLGRIDDATYRRGRSLGAVKLFASLYLGDLDPPTGPYCAFDLDGVLEGSAPGYPAMSEASALALRAVRAHGFRVLLASGRASGELQQRCALLGLDGAVSEYGAVAYDAVVGVSFGLLSEGARRASERLRKLALDSTELTVDHAYTEV
ncbi:MAG: hypothetical protein JWM85_2604, partial [Acidimicrobiaceae bacterium]|nr:hypothetical protein [Acidimicrobiaceae bacterium]